MSKSASMAPPSDQLERDLALDPTRSILVQAPAGSGKTTLLTDRFLTLLGEVDDPGQIVAITFTNAAATEMRNRILDELRSPEPSAPARRALERSNARGWKLLDLPAQLRISTIDSFCRDLALQQPLLSGLGGGLAIAEEPRSLYRRAARRTLEQIGRPGDRALSQAIEGLLEWRDNNWQELEDLLVDMLAKRDRWMHEFVLERETDWDDLRERLERPFSNAVRTGLAHVSEFFDRLPGRRQEILALARFACAQTGGELHRELAELADFPASPFRSADAMEEAHQAFLCLANLLLTGTGSFRKQVDKRLGFPTDRKPEKARILTLISSLAAVPGLESTIAAIRNLPPIRYTEDDWLIVRACFTLLRHAAAQLQVVFAEAAAVDFIQVAQIAQSVLRSEDGTPTDAAIAVADSIRHLLVDEFQDTSRRQHQLLAGLISAWPDRSGRTCFAVGDPMQSIYFFREADAELFARVKDIGLETSSGEPFRLNFASLTANFRTTPELVERLNRAFDKVFAVDDGSGVTFSAAVPARERPATADRNFELHLDFAPQTSAYELSGTRDNTTAESAQLNQAAQIVDLIRSHREAMEKARAVGKKYRIAVLARARRSLTPIARALHEAAIPFRAVDLEKLAARPEVLDVLALGRALLNPQDRVAWMGALRAPWCGLTLDDLYALTSADDPELLTRPIPEFLVERLPLLSEPGRIAVLRLHGAVTGYDTERANQPTVTLGTRLQQTWLSLAGADCCTATARVNLDLLWACLDKLPDGEQDLLSPALDAALDKLTALPDPAAAGDCSVQLMTIHKSKGLEFEVVIVSDLQAGTAGSSRKLLSWLERGLTPEAPAELNDNNAQGEITEFLVAPLQSKGEEPGRSKAWVDRIYRDRESQEMRRILYVAATRAREQLHLFAKPAYKVEADGDMRLVPPSNSLLATAWPALEDEIRAQFDEWKSGNAGKAGSAHKDEIVESIAAVGKDNLIVMPGVEAPITPTLLRRLPDDYCIAPRTASFRQQFEDGIGKPAFQPDRISAESFPSRLYDRHEGGLASRALGTAVHALLEELGRIRLSTDWPSARADLKKFEPRIAAIVRESGIAPAQAAQIAAEALTLALNASHDPNGEWILSPHAQAASEVRWTGVIAGKLTQVRVDRVFRAGLTPRIGGLDAWWIVDYKTADARALDPSAVLSQLRAMFAPQLETYARILRGLHGADSIIRAGLYYPRMPAFDWWEL